jgi:hypothetical protein
VIVIDGKIALKQIVDNLRLKLDVNEKGEGDTAKDVTTRGVPPYPYLH